jgi:zinc protease
MRAVVLLTLLGLSCSAAPPQPVAQRAATAAAPSSSVAPPDPEPWRAQRPSPGQPSTLRFPEPERATLSNGMTVLVARKATPVASLSLVVRHGGAASPSQKSGLAALTARMLTEGTRRRPGVKLAEAVEQLGSTLDDDTGRDKSSLSLSVLTADVERAISLLGEVVVEPAFSPSDFERAQKEWLDGLRAERQAPERIAALVAMGALLGEPHGNPVGGKLRDVQKLTVKDVADFHARAYRAPDAALVVVGDVDLAVVQRAAERAFARLNQGAATLTKPFISPPAPPPRQLLLVDRPGAVQSALAIAQRLPKRADPGHEQRELLVTLFGGLFTSRLNTNLREEHAYTYGARAQNLATQHWGALFIGTSVRTDVTAEALSETLKELDLVGQPKLGKPIAAAELGRARADLVQSVGARLEYGARIGATLADLWLYGLPFDYYAGYERLLAAETPTSLLASAELVDTEHLVIVVVGDGKVVGPSLTKLGFQVVPAPQELLD